MRFMMKKIQNAQVFKVYNMSTKMNTDVGVNPFPFMTLTIRQCIRRRLSALFAIKRFVTYFCHLLSRFWL